MKAQKSYGWFYDKQGNVRNVSAPVNSDLKPIKVKHTTNTGAIPESVGYPNFGKK